MKGKVYLVGAGPGDYKLMTLKGLECIQKADVIVYDRLANENYLKEAKGDCEFIYVGKAGSQHTRSQDEINEIIAHKAKSGQIVTRLKGGDPYVFGRGGEEAEFLLEYGVDFEVVPGITSAIAGAAYAGIPITHRDYASSFHVITGHLKDETSEGLDFKVLAKLEGTLVFLMGVSNLKGITENLIKEGKNKTTPVALISWATRANQSVVTGTLEDIYEKALSEEVKPPTLIVIGEVVKLRDKLNFFENKPLFGKRIVVTRSREQSSALVEKLKDLGALVMEMPSIKIEKIDPNPSLENALKKIDDYQYIIFTSQNAVELFFEGLEKQGKDTRSLSSTKIAAIGKATVEALRQKGILADYVPHRAVAESLYECLKEEVKAEDKILIPHSANSRAYLVDKLSQHAKVEAVDLYHTVMEQADTSDLVKELEKGEIDYITFTSSSTCIHLIELLGKENAHMLKKTKLIAIGPITAKTMREYGLEVYSQPKEHGIQAMVEVIASDSENK